VFKVCVYVYRIYFIIRLLYLYLKLTDDDFGYATSLFRAHIGLYLITTYNKTTFSVHLHMLCGYLDTELL